MHWKPTARKGKLLWLWRCWNTALKAWCEVPVPKLKFKRKSFVSVVFHTDMLFLVGGSILCHAGLDSCKVFTKTRKKLIMEKKSSLLICFVWEPQGNVL